jgi:LysM repeat protein
MARDYSTNRYKKKIKEIQKQKRTAEDKRKSVTDLKKEVRSNKAIGAYNKGKKANEAFGKRVQSILDAFKPKKKAKPGVRSGIKTNTKVGGSSAVGTSGMGTRSGVKTGIDRAGPKGYRRKPRKQEEADAGYRYGLTTMRPNMPKSRATPGTSGMGDRAGPKTGGRKPKTLTESQKKAIRDTKQVTVKSGDTLTDIAKKNGTTVANLKKINPQIKDLNKIKPGQKIRVGGSDAYQKRIGQVSKSPDKPRTIAQAQKMGKKYFFDKNGKRKVAVTAEQLKKSGLTLSQWLKKK